MNVLNVYRTCFPETIGGLEQVMRFITSGTTKLGVRNRIVALTDGKPRVLNHEGTEIHLFKKDFEISSNGVSLSLFSTFKKHAKWADVIHYQYPWPTGDFLSLLSGDKPCLVTYHSDIVRQTWLRDLYAPLKTFFLKKVDKIVATSPQYASSSPTLQKYREKVDVVPLGIDPDSYPARQPEKIDYWKSKVGEDFFLFVGVLRYYKGLDFLLEAGKMSGLPVLIVGDGPLREHLQKRIANENISNVHMTGALEEEHKCALLHLCRAFVFPSHLRSEAFGISLLEAQLFGKPIISCEVGTGSSYVNVNGETGIVVEPANPRQLAQAMSRLAADEDLCRRYGEAGKARFDQLFYSRHMAERYFAIYQEVWGK